MQKINLISQANPNMWQSFYNEFKELFKVEFVFSTIPVHADFHVIVEDHSKLKVANSRERIARIITEPPEIVKYSQKYLSQFGSIISPEFPYLKHLPNYKFGRGLLPRQAGLAFRNEGDIQKFTVSELCSSERDTRSDSISIIISDKRITPQQNVRLELVDYLKKILPNLEVYGRGFNPISDKAEVMLKNKYHLVIENSTYSGYWTEKLVDPILCGNQIFYVGDPDVSKIFPSVIQLSLNRFDECANLIQMHIKQDLYMENQALRDADLNTYLSKENLLCVLEKWALSSKYPKYAEMSISILKPGMRPMKSYVSRVMRLIRRLFFMAEV